MIEFWKQVLYEYSFAVSFEFTLEPQRLVKQFTLFDRRPCGLPALMKVLYRRGQIASREQIMGGSLYQTKQQSTIGWLASGLYSRTIGSLWGP